jgi:hypothetical protein
MVKSLKEAKEKKRLKEEADRQAKENGLDNIKTAQYDDERASQIFEEGEMEDFRPWGENLNNLEHKLDIDF